MFSLQTFNDLQIQQIQLVESWLTKLGLNQKANHNHTLPAVTLEQIAEVQKLFVNLTEQSSAFPKTITAELAKFIDFFKKWQNDPSQKPHEYTARSLYVGLPILMARAETEKQEIAPEMLESLAKAYDAFKTLGKIACIRGFLEGKIPHMSGVLLD